jgi:ABC-type taurine transport system ATPase subunit
VTVIRAIGNPIVLRAIGASFARDGIEIVAPFDLTLARSQSASLAQPTAFAASVAARLCAAIVKPTTGVVYVGDYETRLQPPQAKRLVGFVDAAGFDGDAHAFRCEAAFRADVWGIDVRAAHARADSVVAALGRGDVRFERYARALALALVADVSVLVLDQPPKRIVDAVRSLDAGVAILRTRVGVASPAPTVAEREPAIT